MHAYEDSVYSLVDRLQFGIFFQDLPVRPHEALQFTPVGTLKYCLAVKISLSTGYSFNHVRETRDSSGG